MFEIVYNGRRTDDGYEPLAQVSENLIFFFHFKIFIFNAFKNRCILRQHVCVMANLDVITEPFANVKVTSTDIYLLIQPKIVL